MIDVMMMMMKQMSVEISELQKDELNCSNDRMVSGWLATLFF